MSNLCSFFRQVYALGFVWHIKLYSLLLLKTPLPIQGIVVSHELSHHPTFHHLVYGGNTKEHAHVSDTEAHRLLLFQWPC